MEDFSVYIDQIPVEQTKYNNNPHLLSSMLVPYIEEEVSRELQMQGFSFEEAEQMCQIT